MGIAKESHAPLFTQARGGEMLYLWNITLPVKQLQSSYSFKVLPPISMDQKNKKHF